MCRHGRQRTSNIEGVLPFRSSLPLPPVVIVWLHGSNALMDPCRSNIGGVRTTVTPAALTPMCAVKNLPNQPTNQPKHPFTRACSLPAVPLLKSRRRLWQQYYSIVGLRVWTPMGAQPHTVPKISASILPYVIVLVSSFARLSWSHSAFSPRWTFLLYRILPLHPPMSLVCLDKAGVGPYTLLPL